jgi:Dr1-associated corepressor
VSLLRVVPRKSRRIICASLYSFPTLYHRLRAHLHASPALYAHPHSRKHAIETTEMLDFLKELVEGVPDPSAGGKISLDQGENEQTSSRRKGKKAAANAVDDGDEDGNRPPPAKRRRRKKKEEVREAEGGAPNGDHEEAMQDVAPPSRRDENWDMDDESGGC